MGIQVAVVIGSGGMPQGRPDIPAQLRRDLLVEAGHRCAIPTCKQVGPLEFDHIKPWAQVQKHDFHNIVVLCPTCHALHTTGKIDARTLRQYKSNLALLNSRYGECERRVLLVFGITCSDIDAFEEAGGPYFVILRGRELGLWFLLHDGMIEAYVKHGARCLDRPGCGDVTYRFTVEGRELVRRFRDALPIS